MFIPDITAWFVGLIVVFGGGGLAVMAVGAVRIVVEERRLKAACLSKPLDPPALTYPGRTPR